jgi:hypothetical protein
VRNTIFILSITLLFAAIVGCGESSTEKTSSPDSPAKSADACATCEKGKTGESVWCDSCKAGYVKGEKVTCQGCFTAKSGGPACPTCSAK